MTPARAFVALSADAVRDGLRNRVGLFAIVFALCVGLFADRCTGFDSTSIVLSGKELDVREGARLVGPLVFGICALLLALIAGFVGSDALARPLTEGTAPLWLARPVGRASYALARLAGALVLGAGAGAGVLAVVAALLHVRLGLDPGPAAVGVAVFALDAWILTALAMTLALLLPRVVALAAVVLILEVVVFTNGLYQVATVGGDLLGAIERWGPPFGTALLYAVAPWFSSGASAAAWTDVGLRLVAWAMGSTALLAFLFRRMDVPS